MTVRVRFAPSPTGNLHIGGLRVALFNWLFARKNNGAFLLRIEDTDFERSTQAYVESILGAFSWVALTSDEPIVIQSQRIPVHLSCAHDLVMRGKAYYCYCSQEELEKRVGSNASTGQGYTRYDGLCRKNSESPKLIPDKPYVIRFKVPEKLGDVTFYDEIRGEISFPSENIDDFILVRSGLVPTYNFVVVLDDHWMGITHIIRGEEHISNTPKQILLYRALGYPLPKFAHAPLILGPDGSKLSKRDAATSVLDYRSQGFLPEALMNYLVRLGWASGDQEIFSLPEMIEQFSLAGIGKKGSIFDSKKLEWVNSVYLKKKSADELLAYILTAIDPQFSEGLSDWTGNQIQFALDMLKFRVKTVKELIQEAHALYNPPLEYNLEDCRKWITKETIAHFSLVLKELQDHQNWSVESLNMLLKETSQKLSLPFAQLAQPLRIALTGKSASPGVGELILLLGKKEVSNRIFTFIKKQVSL